MSIYELDPIYQATNPTPAPVGSPTPIPTTTKTTIKTTLPSPSQLIFPSPQQIIQQSTGVTVTPKPATITPTTTGTLAKAPTYYNYIEKTTWLANPTLAYSIYKSRIAAAAKATTSTKTVLPSPSQVIFPTQQRIIEQATGVTITKPISPTTTTAKTTTVATPVKTSTGGYVPLSIKESISPTTQQLISRLPPDIQKQILHMTTLAKQTNYRNRSFVNKQPLVLARTKRGVNQLAPKNFVIQDIWAFRYENPDIEVPMGEAGPYDMVRTNLKSLPAWNIDPFTKRPSINQPGVVKSGFVFYYSPFSKHKIKVAGSIDNYDQYLDIVRTHPELPALHLFKSFLNVDLALASNKPGITGASEREEILIKHLHDWKGSPGSKGELGRMAGAILENPFVQISLSEAGGMAAGKILGGIGGRISARYGPKALQAYKAAQLAGGTALAAPEAYDIYKTWESGDTSKAAGKITMFGLNIASGIQGFREGESMLKTFGQNKGLTSFEAGFKKGMIKSKRFDPLQKEYFNTISKIKQDLRLNKIAPVQEEPTFGNVRALEQYNQQRANVLRNAIKNQLVALKNRAQIHGGAGSEKPSTGDIDELFRSAKDPVVLEYIARKLGIDPDLVFDPHQLPRTGSMVTRGGTPKEPPYIYKSGMRGSRFTEQFYRVSESAMELPHKGRVKDIQEAVRMVDLLYKESGVPKNMQDVVTRFKVLNIELGKNPRIMNPAENELLYNSGLSKKFWDLRTRFYEKTLSKSYFDKQFSKLTNVEKNAFRDMFSIEGFGGGMPPSVSMSSSAAPSSFSALFWNWFPGIPSSKSSGRSSSYIDGYPSSDGSRSSYPSNSNINRSNINRSSSGRSSRSASPNIYPFGNLFNNPVKNQPRRPQSSPSYSPPFSSSSYPFDIISFSSPGRSSNYPSSSSHPKHPRSSPPSRPPSSPPSSPPYYYPPYSPPKPPRSSPPSRPPSSPPSSPPYYPPESPYPLWFPWMGGKTKRRGSSEPYAVQFFNEYEMIQNMMRDVIL